MAVRCCTRNRFPIWTNHPFLSILAPKKHHRRATTVLKPLNMAATATAQTSSGADKRPICSSCSKPSRTCLCTRILSPGLDNSVGVTILQHSLETKHPLNSTRIVKLGLKNVTVATVSDVLFDARCFVWPLEEDFVAVDGIEIKKPQKRKHQILDSKSEPLELIENRPEEINNPNVQDGDWGGQDSKLLPNSPIIDITIGKKGVVSSIQHIWMSEIDQQLPNFDDIVSLESARDLMSKGFVVRKLQKRQVNQSMEELEEIEEFELTVPPGSVLLFPSETSLTMDELKASGFEVKNVIALDGTWLKARRMYCENPWLRFLPQLKLDPKGSSLYGEVRSQPKVGYLSTLESIVYTLKGLGENTDTLDNLLDVFESMVNDQRRCKDERLSQTRALL